MSARALFLDRDGVINVNHGYVHTRERFDFVAGIFDACRRARALGYLLIVATNQAGIGRGFFTEAQFQSLTDWMLTRFQEEGAEISRVYYCPYHPEHGIGRYRQDADCRKPNPGMLLRARDDYSLDMVASALLGDKLSDIEAGRRAGVGRNILYAPDGDAAPEGVCVIRAMPELAGFLGAAGHPAGIPRSAA